MNIETLFTFKGKMKRLPFLGVQVGVIVLFALAAICGESGNDISDVLMLALTLLGAYFNFTSITQRLQDIGLSWLYTIPVVLLGLANVVYSWIIPIAFVVNIMLFIAPSGIAIKKENK